LPQQIFSIRQLEVGEFKARRNRRAHQGEFAARIKEASLPTAGGDCNLHPLAPRLLGVSYRKARLSALPLPYQAAPNHYSVSQVTPESLELSLRGAKRRSNLIALWQRDSSNAVLLITSAAPVNGTIYVFATVVSSFFGGRLYKKKLADILGFIWQRLTRTQSA
jgi:hypothetical protein